MLFKPPHNTAPVEFVSKHAKLLPNEKPRAVFPENGAAEAVTGDVRFPFVVLR
jgi:hypothetical protein